MSYVGTKSDIKLKLFWDWFPNREKSFQLVTNLLTNYEHPMMIFTHEKRSKSEMVLFKISHPPSKEFEFKWKPMKNIQAH